MSRTYRTTGLRSDGGDGPWASTTATVTKLVGAPGSGKTRALLEYAEDEAEFYEKRPADLAFLTFTRSGRENARQRIAERVFPDADPEDVDDCVRTFHSAALDACRTHGVLDIRQHGPPTGGDERLLITQRNADHRTAYFAPFFRRHLPRFPYDPDAGDPTRFLRSGDAPDATGNRLLAVYNYVQNKNWSLERHPSAPIDIEKPAPTVTDALRAWEAYKDRNGLIQHDDYVAAALEARAPPPASVLLVDEMQDLTPLQHALYETWRDHGSVERVYIGGDHLQAVYGFRAADPALFRETEADEVVHSAESYRCPQAVVDDAVPVVEGVGIHDASRVTARDDGGHVGHVDAPTDGDLTRLVTRCVERYATEPAVDTEDAAVYLLARTNRDAALLARGLRETGVPYRDLNPDGALDTWEHPAGALLAALRAFDERRELPVPVAETLLQHVPTAPQREDAKRAAEDDASLPATDPTAGWHVLPEALLGWFPDADDGHDLARILTVDDWTRGHLTTALAGDATHQPKQVRVGTIHAAKGREAPCVLVFPTYSHRQLDRYHDGAEAEERRLYYVAMTRASDTCLVIHDNHETDCEFPPLERDRHARAVRRRR